MEPLALMTKLIEIERALGMADVITMRKLVQDAQDQVLQLHREQFENLSHSPYFAKSC